MIASIRKSLRPPFFAGDEEKNRKARLLNIILLSLFLIAFLYLVFAPIEASLWVRRLSIIGPFLLVLVGLWGALHRGFVQFVGGAVVFSIWAMFTLALGYGAGSNNPAFMGYVVVVVCAGVLLNQRAIILWAGISITTSLLIVQAAERGILQASDSPPTEMTFWFAQTMYLVVNAVLLGIALQNIEAAMVRARQELTDRKRLEKELQEERDFVLQIINTMGQGLTATNEHGEFILANPSYGRLTGYEPQEMVGKRASEMVFPEDQALLRQAHHDREQGKSTTYEIRLRHKNGHGIPVLITGAPRMKEGKYAGAIAVTTDLSEIHQAQLALKESEERFRRLSEASFEAIVISDQGRILDANPQAYTMFGYSDTELMDKPVIDFVAPESREIVIQNIKSGYDKPYEHLAMHKDGTSFPVEVRAGSIPFKGKVVRFTALRDITSRKQAEDKIHQLNASLERRVSERTAELELANRELDSFAYSVSHDLRAPLRAINGFSLILAEETISLLSKTNQHYFQLIRENVLRMNQMVDDLLAFSRFGRQELDKRSVNLVDLINEVLSDFPELDQQKVNIFIAKDLPSCEADPGLLRLVFANLLGNAIKYSRTKERAQIEVQWQNQDGELVYFIRDNGVGFDMRYADKLFGVFQRLHRQDEFEGTGVGLATVQRIIQRHGGRIWVEAEVDKGATFYFTVGGSS